MNSVHKVNQGICEILGIHPEGVSQIVITFSPFQMPSLRVRRSVVDASGDVERVWQEFKLVPKDEADG